MAFESQSLKKKSYAGAGISGDVYSMVMMLPKELEMEKDTNFDLKFHVPDLGRACKVCLILTSLFFLSEIFFFFTFQCYWPICCVFKIFWIVSNGQEKKTHYFK